MRSLVVNVCLAAAMTLILLTYELGWLAPANAFFGAAAALILYTGHQFVKREGMPLTEALADIFARPPMQSRRRIFHFAYLASVALGLLVMVQTLTRV